MNAAMPSRFAAVWSKVALAIGFAMALLTEPAVAAAPVPDMSIFVGNNPANFKQGDVGDTYFLSVSNIGKAASSGTVTVVDTLPSGLTATNIAGTGWNCTLATLTCTRSDAL